MSDDVVSDAGVEQIDPYETHKLGDVGKIGGHKIELRDPDGRQGLYWHCETCNIWFADPLAFKKVECDER